MIYEACVGDYNEGIKAFQQGATRIELCENLGVGGTTPSYGSIIRLSEDVDVPVRVMVRPRGGNFVYTPQEIEIMKDDIKLIKTTRAEGVVFGVLDKSNHIDINTTRELTELARPLKVTFHKAIDEVKDLVHGVKILKEIGIDSILTSGGKVTVLEGASHIRDMIEAASGGIEIIAAGGITDKNIHSVKKFIPGEAFHGKKIVGELSFS